MQRVTTCLMFVGDQCGRAEEAVNLYVSLFEDATIVRSRPLGEDGGRTLMRLNFRLAGADLIAMDGAGPHDFTFTPATSLSVDFDSEEALDRVFAELSEGGAVLMPLQEYPFSRRFAWVDDRYGVSWQLSLA